MLVLMNLPNFIYSYVKVLIGGYLCMYLPTILATQLDLFGILETLWMLKRFGQKLSARNVKNF